MQPVNDMSAADFQKLLALVLNDLTIRRTLLENQEQEVNQELPSLERDAELERLDNQIQAIQADYQHYQKFVDPTFKIDLDYYYKGI